MARVEDFSALIQQGYTFKTDSVLLGAGVLDGQVVQPAQVRAPLKMFNRHGLIAGATGTGKTKTLQLLIEGLSKNGVNVIAMDIKGDLSGLSQSGTENPKISERAQKIGFEWKPVGVPVEYMTLSGENGLPMRAAISEFGPVLLSKILELNDTQSGVVSIVFKYCDDHKLPLLDIKDFRKVLQHISTEAKEEVEQNYGLVAKTSVGAILRKLLEIEQQGAESFFGEKSFDVEDLFRLDDNGYGYVHILRLMDMQSKPALFSTFMMCLLAELYERLPEQGDKELPDLVFFMDEAHLMFKEASKPLMSQLETIIKLIRSKGVGIFFCTQNPMDVPEVILSQLGMKIQHSLRAFTANDRENIRKTAANYPLSDFYETETVLTQMGIGEALITVLNEKGVPTPLVHCLLVPPTSRMDVITAEELQKNVDASPLVKKYTEAIDRESAYEILSKKLTMEEKQVNEPEIARNPEPEAVREPAAERKGREEKSTIEKVAESKVFNTVLREVTRGIFGVLLGKPTRRKSRGLF